MNQSELVEKVAQATELNTRLAGQAVKAVVAAILDSLAAGDAVRVSGLGTFNVAARPARDGRNPQSGQTIKIPASKAVRFHAGKAVKDVLKPPKGAARRKSLLHIASGGSCLGRQFVTGGPSGGSLNEEIGSAEVKRLRQSQPIEKTRKNEQ